jgi:hypothetical protein
MQLVASELRHTVSVASSPTKVEPSPVTIVCSVTGSTSKKDDDTEVSKWVVSQFVHELTSIASQSDPVEKITFRSSLSEPIKRSPTYSRS